MTELSTPPRYAFVFPGQGSQAVGMLAALSAAQPIVANTLAEADDALGFSLSTLIAQGPKEALDATHNTQPALLAAGVAVWRLWQAQGLPPPVALAGHSLGEYSALVAAGALGFADALRLVRLRGQLMQAAVPEGQGGMAAVIGMEDEAVASLCAAYSGPGLLAPANFNCPGQVVVAGQAEAIEWLLANGKAQGARMVMRVGMSVPSHCALLRDAAQELMQSLEATPFQVPSIPVFHNLDAQARQHAEGIRAALAAQLYSPVQWTRTVLALQGLGISHYVESGPGKVLNGLIKRIAAGAKLYAVDEPTAFATAITDLKDAV